jgi:hypothetical protein
MRALTAKELDSKMLDERFNGGTLYHQLCTKIIYEGFTTKDWLCKTFKIHPDKIKHGTKEEVNKLGLDFETLQSFVNNSTMETHRRIQSRYEKFRWHLNSLIDEIESLPYRITIEDRKKIIEKYT